MVTKRAITSLRGRPHDERHAFAVLTAFVVMVVLMVAWGAFFFSQNQYVATEGASTAVLNDAGTARDTAAASASLQVPVDLNTNNIETHASQTITPVDGASTNGYSAPAYHNANIDNTAATQLEAALKP